MGCCLHPILLHGILRGCRTGCYMRSCSASSKDSILQHMCSCSASGEDSLLQCCNARSCQCTGDDMRSRCASDEDGILQCSSSCGEDSILQCRSTNGREYPDCNIILCITNVHHGSHPVIRSG